MWHYEEKRDTYSVLVGNLKEGDYLEDLRADGRIILILIFQK